MPPLRPAAVRRSVTAARLVRSVLALAFAFGLPGAAFAALALSPGCKGKSNDANADAGAETGSPSPGSGGASEATDEDGAAFVIGDAGNRFRDAEPKVTVDPDGPLDPACTGSEVAFATIVVSTRCAITSGRAKELRAALENDAGRLTLRQEAKTAGEGRMTLRLLNTGAARLELPVSYSAKLPAFTVLAEDERHAIFELEAPRFEVAGSTASKDRPHFARIVLPPGGAAVATIAIETGVVKMLSRGSGGETCDGGPCIPPKLTKGRYVLHVGQLLTDVESGAPARVSWDLP